MLAAVGFVLLIACVNVAKSAAGERFEPAEGSRRLIGIGRYPQTSVYPAAYRKSDAGRLGRRNRSRPGLGFVVGVTFLGGILFGFIPAWQASRVSLSETLKQSSRSMTGHGRMNIQVPWW